MDMSLQVIPGSYEPGFPSKANVLGVLVMVLLVLGLKRLMSRTVLGVEVLVPSLVRFVQLAVELTVLPFRHRILVPRLVRLTEGLVLVTMFGIEVLVLATMFGVQVLMLSPVLCRFIVRESQRSSPEESCQRNGKERRFQGYVHTNLLAC